MGPAGKNEATPRSHGNATPGARGARRQTRQCSYRRSAPPVPTVCKGLGNLGRHTDLPHAALAARYSQPESSRPGLHRQDSSSGGPPGEAGDCFSGRHCLCAKTLHPHPGVSATMAPYQIVADFDSRTACRPSGIGELRGWGVRACAHGHQEAAGSDPDWRLPMTLSERIRQHETRAGDSASVLPTVETCTDCGHPVDAHDRRGWSSRSSCRTDCDHCPAVVSSPFVRAALNGALPAKVVR